MNKIFREAKLVTELRSNFWPRSCPGKGKMKRMRTGNLVSKAQPWVLEAAMSRWDNVREECKS